MKREIVTFIGILLIGICSCTPKGEPQVVNIVPEPLDLTEGVGTFDLCGASYSIDKGFDSSSTAYINDFMNRISSSSRIRNKRVSRNAGIKFVKDGHMAPEAYSIDVRQRKLVVKASGLNGVVYAIESIKQTLPTAIYDGKMEKEGWSVPCMRIFDTPRFAYRGLMLDVARHFFDKTEVMRIIDVMAVHKLNRLHLHLTDDQGWRIEIKSFPELTKTGSVRKGTCIQKNYDQLDGIPYGGFYTQEDMKEIISYAASKGIEILPEIDLPGHMQAALAAYPELGCDGGPYEVWTRWGISEDVLCVGKENSMVFLEKVLTEIADLFPYEYIHIGGDECKKTSWENCPYCQQKIKELGLRDDSKHKAEHYLQSYVTERIGNFLSGKGKKIIGWDEILEGKIPDGATVMSWRGSKGGIAAAESGHDAIMTPTTHFYFDYYQSKDRENEPFAIGGYVPLEKVYEYEPELDAKFMKHIMGVQANVWTEYMPTNTNLEYMILPRLAALSEVQWCAEGKRNLAHFKEKMERTVRIYDALGLTYRSSKKDMTEETEQK